MFTLQYFLKINKYSFILQPTKEVYKTTQAVGKALGYGLNGLCSSPCVGGVEIFLHSFASRAGPGVPQPPCKNWQRQKKQSSNSNSSTNKGIRSGFILIGFILIIVEIKFTAPKIGDTYKMSTSGLLRGKGGRAQDQPPYLFLVSWPCICVDPSIHIPRGTLKACKGIPHSHLQFYKPCSQIQEHCKTLKAQSDSIKYIKLN